jgi:MinD superfamily P-loop ATPase
MIISVASGKGGTGKTTIIINRAGVGDETVYEYCADEGIEVLLEIPYERRIAELYSQGIPFVERIEGWKSAFLELFDKITSMK